MTAYLQEILGISGILLVKAFVKGRAERDRFGGINDELRRLQVRQEMIGRWFGMLMGTVQTAGPALIILAGGYLVLQGQTTVGTVVDTASEQLIQAAIGPLFRGRTSLVIAHRLSTVQAADLIAVLDHGRLVEHGTHAQLLQLGGLYTDLHQHQFLPHGQQNRHGRPLTITGA